MPILVKHSGNVSPTAFGAFGAGQGKRYSEEARLAMQRIFQSSEAAKQRNFSASQAQTSRYFQADQAEAGREFTAGQNALSRDQQTNLQTSAQDFQSGEAERARRFHSGEADRNRMQQERMARLGDELGDANAEAALGRQKDMIDYSISAKQRAEFNQMSEAYDEAVRSGEFTPEELQEVHRQILAKQSGIKPLPRMKELSPWPQGQDVGQTWASDDGRFMLGRDKDGKVYKIGETNANPTMADIAKLYEHGHKALTRKVKGADGLEADQAPTPQEVEAWVDRAVQMHRRYAGPQQVQQESELSPAEQSANVSAFTQQAWEGKNPPPQKPVIPPDATGPQVRALERQYAQQMREWTDRREQAMAPVVSSDDQYNGLKAGVYYRAPDGSLRRKQ